MKAIYKKYHRGKNFGKIAEKRFGNVIRELKKLYINGTKNIDTNTIYFFIRRHTSGIDNKNIWKVEMKLAYFKFWIRRLEKIGIIEQNKHSAGGWIITEKVLKYNIK